MIRTASQVKAALRMHYEAPEYAVIEEVRNATGRLKKRDGQQPRYADMIAMSLYPSSGLELIGFEVKVSRADWLKEISDSKKAVAVAQFCDRWILVTHSEAVVKEGELPEGWGWSVVDEDYSVRVIVPAPKRAAQAVTRAFLASLMRNATTSNPDYVEVQSRILEEQAWLKPVPASRGDIKAARRRADRVRVSARRLAGRQQPAVIVC